MPRLLLVEDDIGALAALKRGLVRAGFEVLVATNLPDALSATEHERPEGLLIAGGLQGESATTLVEALRGVDLIRPLIIMGDGTGTGEPSLPKPVDLARLLDLLRELLPGAFPEEAADPAPPPAPLAAHNPEAPGGESRGISVDLARRREVAAKALAEAQARRRAAEAMRVSAAAASKPDASTELAPQRTPRAAEPIALPGPAATSGKPAPHDPAAHESEVVPARRAHPVAQPTAPLSAPASPAPAPNPAAHSLDAELFGDLKTDPAPPREEHPRGASARLTPEPEAARHPPPSAQPPPAPEPSQREAFPPEGLEVALSGSLEKAEPAALLLACQRARLTGQLRLEQGGVSRTLFFADGRLVGAASTSPEERLEALSYRRGLITREQQRLLRAEAQIPTRRLALVMVERGYLKPAELFPLVQERVEEIIYEACGGFTGTYSLQAEQVPDDERVALSRSPVALATEGVRRKYLMERLLAGLGGPATLLRPARLRGPEFAEFGLTARERRLAQAVDGLRNIEELLFESGIEPLPGLKLLYALLLGRAVEIALRGLTKDSSPETEAKIDLLRVTEKYAQVRSANYFEVLGVPPSATAYEIEQAYDRLSREFQPGRFRELRRPELPGQLDEIARVLAEARDILVDEGLREEYRAHLRG